MHARVGTEQSVWDQASFKRNVAALNSKREQFSRISPGSWIAAVGDEIICAPDPEELIRMIDERGALNTAAVDYLDEDMDIDPVTVIID